jgi:enoyl-CoA hydratase/carnithine racemase
VADVISFDVVGETPWITLDRPAKLNAMTRAGWSGLQSALTSASSVSDGPVVITGRGRAFCVGDDIAEVGTLDVAELEEFSFSAVFATIRAIVEYPAPVIIAVNGLAIGGGVELISVADLAVATESSRFSLPEGRLGVWPVQFAGAAQGAMPLKFAKELALRMNDISAADAVRMGLINMVVPDTDLVDEVQALVADIRQSPPAAMRNAKHYLNEDLRAVALPRIEKALHAVFDAQEIAELQERTGGYLRRGSTPLTAGQTNP